MVNKIKPLRICGRCSVLTKLEPEIIELLEKRIIEDHTEHAQLSWDRSSYIRRVLIKHLSIELEDF